MNSKISQRTGEHIAKTRYSNEILNERLHISNWTGEEDILQRIIYRRSVA